MTDSAHQTERQWSVGAWLTLAIAVGWLNLLFLALFSLEMPSDGWTHTTDNAGVFAFETNLTGGPSVLQKKDVLLGIDGLMLSGRDTPRFPPNLRTGQTLRYTIRRGGQSIELDVPIVRVGSAGLIRGIAARWQTTQRDFIVSTVSLLVVALAFLLRPGNLGARYLLLIFSFYCFGQWFGRTTSSLYAYSFPLPLAMWYQLTGPQVWGWYFFPSLILMALAFPVVKYPLRRFPRLLPALLYGIPLVLAIISTYSELTFHDRLWSSLFTPVFIATAIATILTIFGALIHNWLTIREPIARAQLRWLTVGLGAGLGLMLALAFLGVALYGELPDAWDDLFWLLILLPISLAIAITRYRLFDVDIIIRRTLVYSALTGLLALAYLGSILVLQNVFQALTGQGQDQLVTVISTLGIAALFVPLRARVQAFIDRRFFRRKYDAAKTVAEFGGALRDEVELNRLATRLIETVEATMQPAHASLWLNAQPGGLPISRPVPGASEAHV